MTDTPSATDVWLEYAGPSGSLLVDGHTLALGVPVQVPADVAERIRTHLPDHHFIERESGPDDATAEVPETARIAPTQPRLPGPIAAPTSPEGGQPVDNR